MRETAILERDLTRALEEIRPADEERMAQARRAWGCWRTWSSGWREWPPWAGI